MGETQQGINLSNLTLDQLSGLKQQVEEDVQQLTDSILNLRGVVSRFLEGKESALAMQGNKGKDLLVPLTSSLFVAGTLADDEHVLIDIGTGYYVQKTIPQAQEYSERKAKMVTEQISKIQNALNVKRNNLEAVVQVMQQKIQQLQV
eukprot:Phypoly_transcript_25733.p1 GENE.Phypoly_transcript_25733~~Phypoly_transcript_25733.p1  ORF type:complete len:147 (+),score=29.18 Phypoly_transcript_25733:65-505(+)